MIRKVALFIVIALALAMSAKAITKTVLDEYVYTPDPAFSYQVIKTYQNPVVYTYILNMTSQTWLKSDQVSRTQWWHYMQIFVPQERNLQTTALLLIDGHANSPHPPTNESTYMQMATLTQSVVVVLGEVPNEPLSFFNDTEKSRTEDAIIAFCWRKYMETGDSNWITRLPMVKASVRAMDVAQEVVKQYQYPHTVEKFVVAGASKRGWTTWLTAAVEFDKRCVAFIPIVIDVVNIQNVFRHIYQGLCGWPEAIIDYERENITRNIDTPQFEDLAKVIDPLVYNERFEKLPKFIVSASGDQFFPSDLESLSYSLVAGEKTLRYVANADHSLAGSDALESIGTYYMSILANKARPDYSWKINRITSSADNGSELETVVVEVTVNTSVTAKPFKATLWTADNENARDFRVSTIGRAWKSQEIYITGKTDNTVVYEAKLMQPAKGYRAFMVELYWYNFIFPMPSPLKVTTPIYVTPNTLPCTWPPKN